MVKKRIPKIASKKGYPPRLKQVTLTMSGAPWSSSLACAFPRQETVVRAAVEALFEILAEKSELDSKFAQKADCVAENC